MPDVPNLPGVPSLTSYSDFVPSLLVSDALAAITGLLGPSWGVYLQGQPLITPASILTQSLGVEIGAISTIAALIGFPNVVPVTASTVEFEYTADSPISTYPQEQGAFQSYDKVQLPFDIKLKIACGGSASQRQAFFDTLEAIRTSTVLLDILTPEKIYTSCNCKHVDYRRNSRNGVTLILADVWFEQVRVISQTQFSNTQSPADSGTSALGNVQPQTPTSAVSQQFAGLGSVPY